MSQAALPTSPDQPVLHGAALVEQLRHGWSPLPLRTVIAMALGGLRVRMMRSLVTTLSVVLAIAFLSYTGLTNQLTHNLARHVLALEREPAIDLGPVAASTRALAAVDPVATMTLAEQRRLAAGMGLDDVFEKQVELSRLSEQVRSARTGLQEQQESVRQLNDRLQALSVDADADALAADGIRDQIAKAATASVQLEAELERSAPALEALETEVALGKWIGSRRSDADPPLAAALADALRGRQQRLLGLVATPSKLDDADLRAIDVLLPMFDDAGPARYTEHTRRVRALLDQERRKRAATGLATLMRRAGVDPDTTLAGNPLDTWLIVMALITCAVGIANAMLMSVTERIREIGTMKCLGAQDGLVIKLFLLESGLLGVVGAGLGIVVGIVVALLAALAQFHGSGLTHFPVLQAGTVVFWSVLSGIFLAVSGAVYPAFAASRMRPVDALRVDE